MYSLLWNDDKRWSFSCCWVGFSVLFCFHFYLFFCFILMSLLGRTGQVLAEWLTFPGSQFLPLENGDNSNSHSRLRRGPMRWHRCLVLWWGEGTAKVTAGRRFQTALMGPPCSPLPPPHQSYWGYSALQPGLHLLPAETIPQPHPGLRGKTENPTNYFWYLIVPNKQQDFGFGLNNCDYLSAAGACVMSLIKKAW